jgi:hypothetical protein
MCNNERASIKAFSQSSQTVLTNGAVGLLNNSITGGNCSGITINNNAITLKKSGTYLVTVSANLIATALGNLTLQLYNKGVAVPGAIATTTAANTTDVRNINFSILIHVDPSCNCVNNNDVLTLINSGIGATYTNVIIDIVKI